MHKLEQIKLFEFKTSSLLIVQILATIISIIGLYNYSLTIEALLTSLFFYFLYIGIGIGMTMHRYYSHRSFEFKNSIIKYVCTFLALVAGRGSILGWVYIHREHHAFSDTERDPHSPINLGRSAFLLPELKPRKNVNKKLVKEFFNKNHLLVNRFYLLIILFYIAILTIINPWLLTFAWALPIAIGHFLLNAFTNIGHTTGYQNFDTRDNSKNSWPFAIFLFGEGWHNNHHYKPNSYYTNVMWWEFDIIGKIITLLKK